MSEKNEWKLVPVEPTAEMWAAVNKLDDEMAAGSYDGKGASIEQVWNCLVDAAPSAPGDAQDERQAFEAEYVDHHGMRLEDYDFEFFTASNRYHDDHVQSAWWAWQMRARMAAPAVGDARKPDFARAEQTAADFVQDYEWRGEDVAGRDTCYTPNKRERAMITDAILGLLAEPEFIAALAAQVPNQDKGDA